MAVDSPPTWADASSSRRGVELLAFCFLGIYFTGLFPTSTNPNERSRIDMIVAVVERGTFAIDSSLQKFGDHEDKASYGGHYYSNKAPGLALAAIPVYAFLRLFFKEPASANDAIFVVVRILVVTSLTLWALRRLQRRLMGPPFRDPTGMVATAVGFGTSFLFFSRTFFSHAWTASLIFLAWDFAREGEEASESGGRWLAASGFLAGWAVISEYTVVLIAVLLALRVAMVGETRRSIRFALAAFLPAAILLSYNTVCFGSPWSLSSSHEALPSYSALAHQGVFGIGAPKGRVLLAYLLGPSRGTILFSPFWLWVPFGFFAWWRSGKSRADCAFAAAAVVLFPIILSGYPNWEGGYSLGSRYLLPLTFVASLALPFALRSKTSRTLFTAAVAFSVGHFFLLTSSYPYIPPSLSWPAANLSWWSITKGSAAPNLATMFGSSVVVALVLAGLAAAAAFVAAFWPVESAFRFRMVVAAFFGTLILSCTIAFPPRLSASDLQWRESVLNYLSGRGI